MKRKSMEQKAINALVNIQTFAWARLNTLRFENRDRSGRYRGRLNRSPFDLDGVLERLEGLDPLTERHELAFM
jgi:hypothetical protein